MDTFAWHRWLASLPDMQGEELYITIEAVVKVKEAEQRRARSQNNTN